LQGRIFGLCGGNAQTVAMSWLNFVAMTAFRCSAISLKLHTSYWRLLIQRNGKVAAGVSWSITQD